MKKILWFIVCLITMAVNVNAQDSMQTKPATQKNNQNIDFFAFNPSTAKYTEILLFSEKENIIYLDNLWHFQIKNDVAYLYHVNIGIALCLNYRNDITPIINLLEKIVAKAEKWEEICESKNAPNINKTMNLGLDGKLNDMLNFVFYYHKGGVGLYTTFIESSYSTIKISLKDSSLGISGESFRITELNKLISSLRNINIISLKQKPQIKQEIYDALY